MFIHMGLWNHKWHCISTDELNIELDQKSEYVLRILELYKFVIRQPITFTIVKKKYKAKNVFNNEIDFKKMHKATSFHT